MFNKQYSKSKVNLRMVPLYKTLSRTECQQICISEKVSIFHLVFLAIKTAEFTDESFEYLILYPSQKSACQTLWQ